MHTVHPARNNDAIRIFRHAVSLDEHRVRFMPSLYEMRRSDRLDCLASLFDEQDIKDEQDGEATEAEAKQTTDCQEGAPYYVFDVLFDVLNHITLVFFPGTHEIGGGAVKNCTVIHGVFRTWILY
jgi:hypothetical protein